MSQCSWNAKALQEIIAINSSSEDIPVSRTKSAKYGLSSGQIAGIAIAGLAGSLILLAIILRIKGSKKVPGSVKEELHEVEASEKSEMVGQTGIKVSELDGREQQGHEIDGYEYPGHEIDGQKLPGHELGGVEPNYELSGDENHTHELPALKFPGGQMPVLETRPTIENHEMP